MKFQCHVDINSPRDKVIELFDNPANMHHWQDGFVSFEPKDGIPGEQGSTATIKYKMNNRDIILLETITKRDLPHEISGTYLFKEGANSMRNLFERLPNGGTRYTAEVDYYQINSFMMKIMMRFTPGVFKKQVMKWMVQFKNFVEGHVHKTNN